MDKHEKEIIRAVISDLYALANTASAEALRMDNCGNAETDVSAMVRIYSSATEIRKVLQNLMN